MLASRLPLPFGSSVQRRRACGGVSRASPSLLVRCATPAQRGVDTFTTSQALVQPGGSGAREVEVEVLKPRNSVHEAAWAVGLALAAASVASPALAADSLQTMQHGANEIASLSALVIPGLVGDSPFREGLVSGFLLIFFSEIGDKTFFIALLLATRQPKALVFAGTFGALAIMTVISVALGQVLHQLDELIPAGSAAAKIPFDDLIAAALLVYFGVNTLRDARDAEEKEGEEKEGAREVVDAFSADDALKVILTTFALVFAAEWGDKSFLATIALAASSSPLGVTAGAVAGHGIATGVAVAGGSLLSRTFSATTLQYAGGSLFLAFAAATVYDIFTNFPDVTALPSGVV
ncbi:hypothetical protein FOA52_000690 [Chlamydomonas sp. UWO 241]|nr:hypothetical protein FOA52_000690 [Chlamydomonas sp. UWO 241]